MPFEWGLFSPKGLRSIEESTSRLNIWHGAVRSGKTINSIVRWLEYVKTAPPGALLMVGKTERTLKRNILDPIEQMVGSKRFKYNRGTGEARLFGRVVYIAGANDERAEGKIRGMTLAGAYGDELTLWPESFFKMLLSRLSVKGAKLFGTTNPDGPFHWLKRDYLDNPELDLRQWHFTLDDNLNLDPAYVEALKKEYSGLWYKRYILGLWVLAEGVIYDMFDAERHVVDILPAMRRYWIGIDYGTTNPTVFLLVGEGEDDRFYVCREYRWDSAKTGRQKTDAQYSRDLREWLAEQNVSPQRIFYDPSAASFGLQLWQDGVKRLAEADNDVLDGIRSVSSLLGADRLRIHRSCKGLIEEMGNYVWDEKAQLRGEDKPLKQNDHGPDALRYVVNGTTNVWSKWIREKGAA